MQEAPTTQLRSGKGSEETGLYGEQCHAHSLGSGCPIGAAKVRAYWGDSICEAPGGGVNEKSAGTYPTFSTRSVKTKRLVFPSGS